MKAFNGLNGTHFRKLMTASFINMESLNHGQSIHVNSQLHILRTKCPVPTREQELEPNRIHTCIEIVWLIPLCLQSLSFKTAMPGHHPLFQPSFPPAPHSPVKLDGFSSVGSFTLHHPLLPVRCNVISMPCFLLFLQDSVLSPPVWFSCP